MALEGKTFAEHPRWHRHSDCVIAKLGKCCRERLQLLGRNIVFHRISQSSDLILCSPGKLGTRLQGAYINAEVATPLARNIGVEVGGLEDAFPADWHEALQSVISFAQQSGEAEDGFINT